jgi:hypothetical protein
MSGDWQQETLCLAGTRAGRDYDVVTFNHRATEDFPLMGVEFAGTAVR